MSFKAWKDVSINTGKFLFQRNLFLSFFSTLGVLMQSEDGKKITLISA